MNEPTLQVRLCAKAIRLVGKIMSEDTPKELLDSPIFSKKSEARDRGLQSILTAHYQKKISAEETKKNKLPPVAEKPEPVPEAVPVKDSKLEQSKHGSSLADHSVSTLLFLAEVTPNDRGILDELGRRLINKKINTAEEQEKSVRLFRRTAEQENATSQTHLGYCYLNGIGVKKDTKEAVRLFKLAAEEGHPMAQYYLYECWATSVKGIGWFEARRWLFSAADKGVAEAQFEIGYGWKHRGTGLWIDDNKSAHWYKLAAKQGHAYAQYSLGVCYEVGAGVEKDLKEAVRLYKLAAEQGIAQAQTELGFCYENGKGVEKEPEEAMHWYKLAAEQGYAQAQYFLGICYGKGDLVEKDLKEEVRWYKLAAEQGHAKAQNNLGFCYRNGSGVEKDDKEGIRLYRLAAAQGSDRALNALNNIRRHETSLLSGTKKEDEETLRQLLVSKALVLSTNNQKKTEKAIRDLINQTPNRIIRGEEEGDFTKGPSKSLEKKRSEFEKRIRNSDVQASLTYLQRKLSQDALTILLAYWAGDFSPAPPRSSSIKKSITNLYLSFISFYQPWSTNSFYPAQSPKEDKKLIPIRKNTGNKPSTEFFKQPPGDEKLSSGGELLESKKFNLEIVIEIIKSTLKEIASSSDEPSEIKNIKALESINTAAGITEWLSTQLEPAQYVRLKLACLDKAEAISIDTGENTFLEKQQFYLETYQFLHKINPILEEDLTKRVGI